MDYILSILGPLAEGSLVTLKLFFITLLLAVPLGLALALIRISRFTVASQAVNGYIWLMRGTPLMLQLLFIYFALPFVPVIGVRLPDFPAAIVAFALNYAAYFAEIFRAGIQSIDRGQYEGAKVLGFSYSQTMRRISIETISRKMKKPGMPIRMSSRKLPRSTAASIMRLSNREWRRYGLAGRQTEPPGDVPGCQTPHAPAQTAG